MSLGLAAADAAPWYAGQRLTNEDRLEALASALAACSCMADLNDLMRMPSCRAALRAPAAAWMVHVRFTELTARAPQPSDGGTVAFEWE